MSKKGSRPVSINKTKEENIPPPSGHLVHPKYRPDIDGLRAVAVLSVVVYHAFPSLLKGGFVGVDIFFVISGFLISTIIFSSLERDSFSFYDFYSRRIRRIFPALLVVLISCYAFGWFALLADEYKQLGKHIAAGAGFVSNLVLWSESGYFDAAAETKPLLHLWSLGIEEQFYIVWPVLLWAAWKKKFNLLTISLILFFVSFGLNLSKYRVDGVADFYSPQTRFWELLAGSLLAYITHHNFQTLGRIRVSLDSWLGKIFYAYPPEVKGQALRDTQSLFGALLISLGLVLITKEKHFPGTWAILPVLGAVCIIAAGSSSWFNRIFLSNRIMVWFGIISFPLYLWHWPLLSFVKIIEGGVGARSIRIVAVLLSIALAWLTYKLVEHPLRFGGRDKFKVSLLLIVMTIIGFVGYNTYQRDGLPSRASIKRFDVDAYRFLKWSDEDNFDTVCQKHFGKIYSYCKLSNDAMPTVALIGDSFANSYFYGLSAQFGKSGDNLVMLGAGGCPPLIDITSGFSGQADWCNSMSSDAIKQVSGMPSVHTVILAANWHLYINGTRFYERYDKKWEIRAGEKAAANSEVFATQIKKTIELLSLAGKNVIVMKQTPEINLDPASCLMRRPFSIAKKESRCEVLAAEVRSYLKEYENIFDKEVPQNNRVKILDPFSSLCSDTNCSVMDSGYPIYRDNLHLSRYGSTYFANRLNLPKFDNR